MDVSLVIKQRLNELGLDQRDLAAAIQVTDSYISQILTRKKDPPAPGRTDIYDKMSEFLKLPACELSKLADVQRRQELKKRMAEPPRPLFQECRELVLRKCQPERRKEVRRIFEKEPFGELERLVTQKLLDVAQGVAKEELRNEEWLRLIAQLSDCSYEQMRVAMLEFLDTDVFSVSVESCVSFLDPMIDSWDVDLKTFGMEVILNARLAPGSVKRFEFAEQQPRRPAATEPGLQQFLRDKALSGDTTAEEIEFLKRLKFNGRRPSPLYYYRELQNLRDPLHFLAAGSPEGAALNSSVPRSAMEASRGGD
jgi:transcriptional regulator with XRE-family HTH domain